MVKKVVSVFVLLVFTFTGISFDFLYLRHLPVPLVNKIRVAYADTAMPYCLPTNDGTKVGAFSQKAGYCVLEPEDSAGKCLAPYIYSPERKLCISQPLCSGTYIWNAESKQCESITATPVGDTEPVFPDNSCAVDSNGNGEIEQNEIHQCQQTPQGYICPVGQTQCNPQYQQPSCPAQYTYNPGTQKCEYTPTVGVCSSQQVPVTQYQCPVNGQIYSDLNQCNSACIQTAQCTLNSVNPSGSGSWQQDDDVIKFVGSGNQIIFYDRYVETGRITFPSYISISGTIWTYVNNNAWTLTGSGNVLYASTTSRPGGGQLTFSGVVLSGSFYMSLNNGRGYAWSTGNSIRFYEDRFGTGGYIYFNTFICPFGAQYSCTGNPPTCQKGQACVTYNQTVTKWQCSLTGTQYDTQEQCTTSCYSGCPPGGTFNPSTGKCEATATCQTGTLQPEGCFTGYGCPLGNYQCQNLNGTWMCSPHQCITSSQLQDEGDVIPFGYEDDGQRDAQGNCLETIYIFNGKGMRCRKSGVQTGFHNCCNESQGKIYDSTGSTGKGVGYLMDIGKTIYGIYRALSIGNMASNIASKGGQVIFNTSEGTAKVFYTGSGKIMNLSYEEGSSLADSLLKAGVPGEIEKGPNGASVIFQSGGNADAATGLAMGDFIKNSGITSSVVSLATSLAISDPVLSASVNLVAQAYLWYIGWGNPIGFAAAVAQLGMSLFMQRCDQQDIITSTFNDSKYCHEVGEYCIKRWPLVGCVQKAKSFCCFNSKLARIIHEQGRPQLEVFQPNGAWTGIPGDPNFSVRNPNCRGFTPEEFQSLDFNKIDLSEYIEDIQKNIRQNLAPQLQQQIQQNWGR